jgi:hypothetical protein
MLTSKSVRLSAGVIAIMALLAPTKGCTQSPSTPAVPKLSTPAEQGFERSPQRTITARLCFANGCCYNATAGVRDNIIISLTEDRGIPKATVPPFEECKAVNDRPGICESETGLTFCPPVELGRPPIQGRPGGTCYYPPNSAISC